MEEAWLPAVQELMELLQGTSIVELELHDGDLKVSIKRDPGNIGAERILPSTEPVDDHFGYVTAPLLGTFYRSPSPGTDAFVKDGDWLEQGQVIGLIEAMKIFNEIQAEVSGRVQAILAEDGAFVEADQRLIAVDTHANKEEEPT